jgi:hypothetical protein
VEVFDAFEAGEFFEGEFEFAEGVGVLDGGHLCDAAFLAGCLLELVVYVFLLLLQVAEEAGVVLCGDALDVCDEGFYVFQVL